MIAQLKSFMTCIWCILKQKLFEPLFKTLLITGISTEEVQNATLVDEKFDEENLTKKWSNFN